MSTTVIRLWNFQILGVVVHISIIGGKIWIQHDGTEEGVATELSVPKAHIVLGFRHPSERQYTGLAVA